MHSFRSLLLCCGLAFVAHAADLAFKSPNGTSVVEYGKFFDVAWDKGPTTNPISIWLYTGYGDGMTQFDTVVSNTANDGEYSWVVATGKGIPSGCSYSMLITDGASRVWSSYFSVNYAKDGGLPANTNCTSLATNPVYPSVAAGAAGSSASPSGTKSSGSTSTRSSGSSGSTSTSNSNSGSGSNSNGSNSSTGVSPAVLGGAIGGAVVALLAIFGIILCCMRKKGYLRKQADPPQQYQQPAAQYASYAPTSNGYSPQPPPSTLAEKPVQQHYVQPVGYEAHGREVHMLDGRPGVAQLP